MRGKSFNWYIKNKKSISYTILIIIIISVGLHYCFHVTWDAIVQTLGTIIGSFAGAALAGKYAISAVKQQIEFNKKENKRNELERFLKDYYVVLQLLELCKIGINNIINFINNDNALDGSKQIFEINLDNLDRDLSMLEKFNYKNIPLKNHKDLLNMINILRLFYWDSKTLNGFNTVEVSSNLVKLYKELEVSIEIFRVDAVQKETEFNLLNNK